MTMPSSNKNKGPDKPHNQIFNGTVPRSMANGGTELDEGCTGLDKAVGQRPPKA